MSSLDNLAQSFYCYVDESGNPGQINAFDRYFVMVAIVVGSDTAMELNTKVSEAKIRLGLSESFEFKFSETKKDYVKEILKLIKGHNIEIYAVILDKSNQYRQNRYSLYNDLLLELLNGIMIDKYNVEIDGKVGKVYRQKVKTFIRKNLQNASIGHFRYTDSKSSNMIQLADLIAGAVGRSLTDKPDANDYVDIIRDLIVCAKEV